VIVVFSRICSLNLWPCLFVVNTGDNIELNQAQVKLIDTHQQQMQTMKNELDTGYNRVLNEYQHEQTRLQVRCEQYQQQLLDNEQIQRTHVNELSQLRDKAIYEQDQRHRHENLEHRVEHLMKLLEQTTETYVSM
jgi:selenocysteine-specific translation elongation factor